MGIFKVRNPQTIKFRVITFDPKRKVWVVKKSGLNKQEAEKVVSDYFSLGITARMKAND